ncbi:ribonuclease domain-containing protein [Frisingicoccus sp.]|uniref:ribonuclease domain-containing protein n=1 Tax=Frisingicoccus sp. TaxID=1918627 RepID=UPI0037353C4F
MKKYIRYWLLAVWMVCMTIIGGCSQILDTAQTSQVLYETETETITEMLAEDGVYTSKEDVALYIHLYGKLPENFITKKEAKALGWEGGSLEPYAPGKSIGGDRFGNYEGILPEEDGVTYKECDIDTMGADQRGAKRIVFSNEGTVYYTEDHYKSFELLYGEE